MVTALVALHTSCGFTTASSVLINGACWSARLHQTGRVLPLANVFSRKSFQAVPASPSLYPDSLWAPWHTSLGTLRLVARTRLQKSKCSWQAVMTRKHSISVLFIMAKFTTVFTVYSRLKTLQYRREMPDDQISKNSLFTGGGLWQTQDSGLEKEALRNKSIVSDNSFCDECN